MVHSSYFIGGYAIHGYASVPELPGEPRLPAGADPERASIFNWIDLGDPIYTYE